jgi:acyl-CoA synthetase (AMP-forming)/AMP-acid ligase II
MLTHKQSRKTESLPKSKIAPETAFRGDEWIRHPHSPFVLINSQGKLSRCELRKSPETTFTGDEWIRQPTLPLSAHKQSRKTESLPTQKKTLKLLSQVTNGFVSPHSPCVLINSQGKLSRCPLRNSPRKYFQR